MRFGKRNIFIFFFIWISFLGFAQNQFKEEQCVVDVLNRLRAAPAVFAQRELKAWADSMGLSKSQAYHSLVLDLSQTKPLSALSSVPALQVMARSHALDMGKTGKVGHTGSGGGTFDKRAQPLLDAFQMLQENCQYGYYDPLSVICDLLIDEGVPGYGHRKSLLNPQLRYVGVSFENHKKYKINCVIELAGDSIR
jgi:uncharacterized protein YkwD